MRRLSLGKCQIRPSPESPRVDKIGQNRYYTEASQGSVQLLLPYGRGGKSEHVGWMEVHPARL